MMTLLLRMDSLTFCPISSRWDFSNMMSALISTPLQRMVYRIRLPWDRLSMTLPSMWYRVLSSATSRLMRTISGRMATSLLSTASPLAFWNSAAVRML